MQRKNKTKGSGGRKKQHILDAEAIILAAGFSPSLPKNYPVAPALKKLMKSVAAGDTQIPTQTQTQAASVLAPEDTAAASADKAVRRKRSAESATQSQLPESSSVTEKKAKRAKKAVKFPTLDE